MYAMKGFSRSDVPDDVDGGQTKDSSCWIVFLTHHQHLLEWSRILVYRLDPAVKAQHGCDVVCSWFAVKKRHHLHDRHSCVAWPWCCHLKQFEDFKLNVEHA